MLRFVTMPSKYRNSYGKMAALCPNCNKHASLVLRDRRQLHPELTDNVAPPPVPYVHELVWSCSHCEATTAELNVFGVADLDDPNWQDRSMEASVRIWPPSAPRELADDVPLGIRSLYREASECENAGALRGAAALYRATVEELCTERGADGLQMYHRIENLKTKGLTDEVVNDLHEARLLGNWTLHDGLAFSADEVADVAELIQEACVVIYVQPAQRAAMRAARRARSEEG